MKRFKDFKIRTKLVFIFMAAALAFTSGIGYFVIRISSKNLISEIKARYQMEAADHMAAIDLIMDKNYHQIQSFAQNEAFTRGTSTPEEITEFLKYRKEIYGYTSLSYFDMNRIRIADTEGLHLGEQHAMVRYWEDVLSGKVSAGADVQVAEELKIPVVYFASAVKNKEGKAIGVVVARFNPEDIAQIIAGTEEEGRYATLIDREGNILFSSSKALKKLVLREKILELTSVKSVLSGQDGTVLEYSPYHEKEFFTSYVHEKGCHDFKGNGWSLLISLEKEKAFAPIQPLRNAIIGALILMVFTIFIIASLIAYGITKPVIELNKVAQKIKAGDLTRRAKITAHDEIGELSTIFNQTIDRLEKSYKDVENKAGELKELNAGLEEKVAERTKELKEKYNELTQSQTAMLYMVEDLNRQAKELKETQNKLVRSEKLAVIGQLASSVAHEIRNPLGVMKNAVYYFNMLELGKEDAEIKENLDILSHEIENVDKIISDLLEFSRVKKPTLRQEGINVIVNEVLRRLKVPRGIEVVTKLDEALPEIEVDALQVQQVFYNISTNAIQAMEKGGTLTISTRVQKPDNREQNGFVEILFKDTGSGIPKENLTKIFEPLFSTKTKGTGLGLSVVASLVEGHGGKIEIESEAGKGSMFTVKLPIK